MFRSCLICIGNRSDHPCVDILACAKFHKKIFHTVLYIKIQRITCKNIREITKKTIALSKIIILARNTPSGQCLPMCEVKWKYSIRNLKDPQGQIARWFQCIESYNLEVIHRPGRFHGNADALSRIPCKVCTRYEKRSEEDRDAETDGLASWRHGGGNRLLCDTKSNNKIK